MMTFNSLIDEVMATLDRTDAETRDEVQNNFIYEAHQQMCRDCKTIGIETYVNGVLAVGAAGAVMPKPANWRKTITWSTSDTPGGNVTNQLELRTYEYLRQYSPDVTQLGRPKYYADYGFNNFLLAPAPDAAYAFEMAFIGMPPPLTVANQTNWFTDYAPDVLKYCVLIQCISFLKNDERLPLWQQQYAAGIAAINGQDIQRYVARTSDRSAD